MSKTRGSFVLLGSGAAIPNELKEHVIYSWSEAPLPLRAVLLDPWTWGWVAVKICEGVLEEIGAQIFQRLFGNGGVDFQKFEQDIIRAVSQVINQAFDDHDIREIGAQIDSLQTLLKFYIISPDSLLLTQLLVKSADVVTLSNAIGLRTVGCFAVDGSLQLSVVQEKFKITNKVDDKRVIAAVAGDLVGRVPGFRDKFVQWNRSRFSEIMSKSAFIYPGGGNIYPGGGNFPEPRPRPTRYYYTVDGLYMGEWASRAEAQASWDGNLQSEEVRMETIILGPLYAARDKWMEVLAANQ